MKHIVYFSLALPAAALAQDNDNDGVLDANDNCVSIANNDQAVGQPEPYDFVGDACFPGSAVIAPKVTIDVTSRVGESTVLSRQSAVINGTVIGDDCIIGRLVSLDNVTIGNTTTIGYSSIVGVGAVIGERVVVGTQASIGVGVTIASDVVLGRGVVVEDHATIGSGVVVGPNTIIRSGAIIQSGVRLRKNVEVGQRAIVRSGARVGRDATIGNGADVGANANLAAEVQVGEFASVNAGEAIPRGTALPPGDCSANLDPDVDGLFGCADPDCFSPRCPEICDDGADNDGDGNTDASDTEDCAATGPEVCDNGVDDTGNQLVDCADPTCFGDVTCDEALCDDGMDNDQDGLTDCEDEDCWGPQCHTATGAVSWVSTANIVYSQTRYVQRTISTSTNSACATQGISNTSYGSESIAAFRARNITGKVRVQVPSSSGFSFFTETCDWSVDRVYDIGPAMAARPFQREGFQITNPENCRLGTDPATQSWFLPQNARHGGTDSVAWATPSGGYGGSWYRGTGYTPTPAPGPSSSYYVPGTPPDDFPQLDAIRGNDECRYREVRSGTGTGNQRRGIVIDPSSYYGARTYTANP